MARTKASENAKRKSNLYLSSSKRKKSATNTTNERSATNERIATNERSASGKYFVNSGNTRFIWAHGMLSNMEKQVPPGASVTFMSPLGACSVMNKKVATKLNNLLQYSNKNSRNVSRRVSLNRSTYTYRHPETYINLHIREINGIDRALLSTFLEQNKNHYVIACRTEGSARVNENMIKRHMKKEGKLVTHIVNNERVFSRTERIPINYWGRVNKGMYASFIPSAVREISSEIL